MDVLDRNDPLLVMEHEIQGRLSHAARPPAAELFDEDAYLKAFPDIARSIAAGEWRSAMHHYIEHGQREDRLRDERYRVAFRTGDTATFPAACIDAVFVGRSGHCFVIGWIDDGAASLARVDLVAGGKVVATTRQVARRRREDAEAVATSAHGTLLGFWTMLEGAPHADLGNEPKIVLTTAGEQRSFAVKPSLVADEQLRELALEYFAASGYFGNPHIESHIQLEGGAGAAVIGLNVAISRRIMAGAYHARFGPARKSYDGSIVVCLYGKAEFLFLQAALFSNSEGWQRYEFVYVSNSPELAETLLKEAALAARLYDVSITLVILPGNAGFGAANNAAVGLARSRRILVVNPDVFPRRTDWAARHAELVRALPAEQTAMFGVPLYYDDGSLMHGGMFFESDTGLSVRGDQVQHRRMIRVEHYGKGAPAAETRFVASRPVPAITGAFISADRGWFESLGGFSLEYVFGHYEDADLCLKSLSAGRPVWMHDVPFWHFEGKGSTRRLVHEGGSQINRWHFTRTWGDLVHAELLGRAPKRISVA